MTTEPTENESGGISAAPDLSEAIERLMAHPEIIEMAASVLGQAPPAAADSEGQKASEAEAPKEAAGASAEGGSMSDALPELLKLVTPLLQKGDGKRSEHSEHSKGIGKSTALLLALKPYLSPQRCAAVDKIVQVSKLGEILEKMS